MKLAIRLGVMSGLFVVLASTPLLAQEIKREAVRRIDTVDGAKSFAQYCAVCHGETATGTGPAAKALKTPPADLTTITKRHGTFSISNVERKIIGTDDVLEHGTREMPIWGPAFRAMETDEAAKLRVHNLVEYLRSIQKK